jgi:phage gpG-like protein
VVKINYIADTREVTNLISKLLRRMKDPSPFIKEVIRYVKAITMKMFRGPRPDLHEVRGVTWPKLMKSTLKAKRAAGFPNRPLVRTGKMVDSIKVLYKSKTGFVYGTEVKSSKGFPYPAAHNAGGPVEGRPPQRVWLFLTKTDCAQLLKDAIDFIEGRLHNVGD